MVRRRSLCWLALALGACGPAAASSSPTSAPMRAPTTTSSIAPQTTTTSTSPSPPPTTALRPVAPATTAAPRPVTTAPPTTAVPVVRVPSGRAESCGWAWDARRVDDGSLNEVTIMLDAPRRPNAPVTLTVKPGASLTSTPALSQATATDGDGQASATFALSNDKRDWTLAVSASFAAGGVCTPQTFTLVY